MVCDTSALLASLDADQRLHASSRDVLEAESGPLYVSPLVLAELDYFLTSRFGVEAELAVLADVVDGAYALTTFDRDDLLRATQVIRRYDELGVGLADASIVVLAERYETRRIFTLDRRHFEVMRPLQGGRFEISP